MARFDEIEHFSTKPRFVFRLRIGGLDMLPDDTSAVLLGGNLSQLLIA